MCSNHQKKFVKEIEIIFFLLYKPFFNFALHFYSNSTNHVLFCVFCFIPCGVRVPKIISIIMKIYMKLFSA